MQATAAGFAALTVPATTSLAAKRQIVARPGKARLLDPEPHETEIWGYDGSVPGPLLRVRQGDEFVAELVNGLDQPTTIHWHGIRLDNAMDGVAGLTQPPVAPAASFEYRFRPPDAGTYWYHPHYRTWEQLARGLYGVLIVDEQEAPVVDQDRALVFDDWRLDEQGAIDERSLGSLHDKSHAGRLGHVVTVNGQASESIQVRAGQRLRLRLINAATARIMAVRFEEHDPIVIALDGQPTPPHAPDGNVVLLGPAQRADVIVDCAAEPGTRARILVLAGRDQLHVGDLLYSSRPRLRSGAGSDMVQLPPNPMPTAIDLNAAKPVALDMTGGAMSPFNSARYKGREYGFRELALQHGKVWAFNGIVGMPEQPIAKFQRGETAVFRMVNRTVWPHAMHFHGHHVREIAHSARSPSPHWRDTVLLRRGETVAVAFQAHNPGRWMLHCHMLAHQAGGMGTWYEVS